MTAIRIRRKLDSETLHLPELKPLLGKIVEITVEEQPTTVRDQFYAEAGRLPETEEAFKSQLGTFRAWRNDSQFEPYWPLLDKLIARPFDQVRLWAASAQAARNLKDYDFEAWRDQREYHRNHASDHLP